MGSYKQFKVKGKPSEPKFILKLGRNQIANKQITKRTFGQSIGQLLPQELVTKQPLPTNTICIYKI